MKVFISHTFSDEDLELAKKLQQFLYEVRVEGYLAETRKEYDKLIRNKIIAEIRKSDHMIAILTEKTFDSASVNQELGYALREGISPIIMREKKAKQGVLTFGLDTEEFTRATFLESCKRVLIHIQNADPRERNPENVSEILKKIGKIESKLDNQNSQVIMGYSNNYPEDQWYNDIMKVRDESLPEEIEPLPAKAKHCYSGIQMLRLEVDELSRTYEKKPTGILRETLSSKKEELELLRQQLREWWMEVT